MAQYVGRMLNEERPRLDARLPDGSRIHVVMPPIARKGCTISIRKFFKEKLTVDRLVDFGSMSPAMSRLIDACVALKENMVVSGGTGSGKTTLLNCVASYIPDDERILTIEDSSELQLNQEHLVPFESRPPDKFGKGGVDMGDLLHSALRLRPDRIVVGEVRGGEAFHLMQAMNTGHGGSLCTVHANTPSDTLRRLESLCLQSGIELPMVAVRAQVASAINVVICCARLQDGSRKTTHIAEVLPLNEKGDYRTQDLFVFTPTGKDEDGKIQGYHAPTGLLPTFLDRLAAFGFEDIDAAFFDPATYGEAPPPVFHVDEGYQPKWAPSLKHREDGIPDPEPAARPQPAAKAARPAPKPEAKAEAKAAQGPRATPVPEPEEEPAPADPDPARHFDDELDDDAPLAPEPPDEEERTDPGLAALGAKGEPDLEAEADVEPEAPPVPEDEPKTSVGADALSPEEADAVAAALAAATEAPDLPDEPSIQLADDFAQEAAKVGGGTRSPVTREQGRRRRKRGGVVGAPKDDD